MFKLSFHTGQPEKKLFQISFRLMNVRILLLRLCFATRVEEILKDVHKFENEISTKFVFERMPLSITIFFVFKM